MGKSVKRQRQQPGQYYRFESKHLPEGGVCIFLPQIGEANDEVYWHSTQKKWTPREVALASMSASAKGEGPSGFLSRARYLLRHAEHDAKRRNHCPPNITAEELSELWNKQNNLCYLCGGPMKKIGRSGGSAAVEHCHLTGRVRGFAHQACNNIRGFLEKIENRETCLNNLFLIVKGVL